MGSAPLVFFNGASDYQRKLGIQMIKVPPQIVFEGSNLVVDDVIREALLGRNFPNLHIHPAVYIHDDGKRYDNYWYLTFSRKFDCWDRKTSSYHPRPISFGGEDTYEVVDYHLSDEVMDATPIEQRLLFKMGGTNAGSIVCHESIVQFFGAGQASGADIVRIDKYE